MIGVASAGKRRRHNRPNRLTKEFRREIDPPKWGGIYIAVCKLAYVNGGQGFGQCRSNSERHITTKLDLFARLSLSAGALVSAIVWALALIKIAELCSLY